MEAAQKTEITGLLIAWSQGDNSALEKLIPIVYKELHRLAHRYMNREKAGHTLQTTGLVNEAYLRLVDMGTVNWQNRSHFFAISSRLMRRILVDLARSRANIKHGGKIQKVPFDEAVMLPPDNKIDFVALDEALNYLAEVDERKSKVVEMRFFGGMTVEESAAVLKV